jgi:hypothetical protein
MSEVKAEFDAAIATARHALEQYRKEPILHSKRGAPTPTAWFRIWRDASEVAARWHRQMQTEGPSFDDELDEILGRDGAG